MSITRFYAFSRLLKRNARVFTQRVPKRFSSSGLVLNVDQNNVISSSFPNITGFEGILLHDFLLDGIDKWHDRTATECCVTGRSYTYGQLRKISCKLAASLRKCKLQPGDTIAVVLPNVPEYIFVVLGASMAGLRTCLINPVYTVEEIRTQVLESDSVAMITTPTKHNDVEASIQNNPKIRLPIIVVNDQTGPTPSNAIKFEDLVRDDIEEFLEESGIDAEDDVLLPYSSGTTGRPKGVQLSHRNIVTNIAQITDEPFRVAIETTKSHQDVVPVILPLYHIYGLVVVLFAYLRYGAKLVCMPQFSTAQFINVLEKYRPHVLYIVPPMIQMMANNDLIQPRYVERTRLIFSGAAPIGKELITKFQNRVNSTISFCQGYGMTESAPCLTLTNAGPSESVGYLVPNTQLRIVGYNEDGTTKNLGVNETGEIYARGPQIMKGYYKNPQATADTMDGDWLKTGDLASCTKEGLFYIKGRLKEIIKVKGYQVSPAEVEDVIRGFDKVQDVAVIGVPDEKFGEIPKAFIVPKKGINVSEDEIKAYVAKRVAKYKQIGFVEFLESIPKSGSGKILRKQLQNL